MRIGISAPRRSSTPSSGVGRYVQGLLGALLRIDRQNAYVLIGGDPPPEPAPPNLAWEPVRSDSRLGRILWDHHGIKGAARRLGLDVLLAAKTVLPRALPCRGVCTVHDLAFLRHPEQYPWDFRFYWNRVMRGLVESEHRFLCDSAATARDLVELLGAPPARVHTAPCGIDRQRFAAPPADRVRARLEALGIEGPYALFVGNLIPRKNLPRLAEAFRIVRSRADARLVVAGLDMMGMRFDPEVRTLGEVADDDLVCLYAGARLLAFPSLYEGFGFPILEAMAAGCPVVASDRGSLGEVGGDAVRVVDPLSVENIAEGILAVLQDDRIAAALREAGFRRAAEFSWERTARESLKVLAPA